MSDLVAQTAMFQCDKGGMHKLVVIMSPATGDSQSIAANGNCLLVPQGTPCSLLYGAPCPMVVTIVSKEGQSTVEVGGAKALGADCEFMCPMGGKLTAQSHGQAIATHNEASAGLQIASLIIDFIPIACTIKSAIEVITGVDPITGEATSRLAAAAGLVPGGKAVTKGGKIVKAIVKGEKGAAKAAKMAAKTEKVAVSSAKVAAKSEKVGASSAKAASKGEKAAVKNSYGPKAAYNPHPVKSKALTPKEQKQFKQKVDDRTLKKEDWNRLQSEKRLKKRRDDGVDNFWTNERDKISNNQPTSRDWTNDQKEAILQNKRPKITINGKETTFEGHHKYSVREYPQAANDPMNIEPVTRSEHLQRHGGNFRNPTPLRK